MIRLVVLVLLLLLLVLLWSELLWLENWLLLLLEGGGLCWNIELRRLELGLLLAE